MGCISLGPKQTTPDNSRGCASNALRRRMAAWMHPNRCAKTIDGVHIAYQVVGDGPWT